MKKTNIFKTLVAIVMVFFMSISMFAQAPISAYVPAGAGSGVSGNDVTIPSTVTGIDFIFRATGNGNNVTDWTGCSFIVRRIQFNGSIGLIIKLGSTSASKITIIGNSSGSGFRAITSVTASSTVDGTYTAVTGATVGDMTFYGTGTEPDSNVGCWSWTVDDLDLAEGTFVKFVFNNNVNLGGVEITPTSGGGDPVDYSKLVVNEVSGEHKYVEIYNSGTVSIPLEGVRLQRNDGPTGGSERLHVAGDVIPAGAYRLYLFNSFTPTGSAAYSGTSTLVDKVTGLDTYPEFVGWSVSSGISDQQILKIALVDPDGAEISTFIRGDAPLPAWGGDAARVRTHSYSRMTDGTWAYAVPTPGAENGAKVSDIVDPGYLTETPADAVGLVIESATAAETNPVFDEDVIITAVVTDDVNEVETVVIEWKIGAVDQTPIPMEAGVGALTSTYTADIPGQAEGVTVTWKVTATNDDGDEVSSDEGTIIWRSSLDPIVAGDPDALAGKLLIWQAFGTGSGGGAGVNRSFLELYNTTENAIDLAGITLFYADGTDMSNNVSTEDGEWKAISLTGTLPGGTSFLVLGPVRGSSSRLNIDANYGDINDDDFVLSNRAFKAALIRNANADLIAQNPFDMDGNGAVAEGYIDMLGSANSFSDNGNNRDRINGYEMAPSRNSGSEAVRRGSLVDTDNNSVDFVSTRYASGTGGITDVEMELFRPKNMTFGAWNPLGDPASVQPLLNGGLIAVYPNPVENELTVEIENPTQNTIYRIFDLSGKQLKTGRLNAVTTQIPMGDLSEGMYVLSIEQNGQVVQSLRVVKQ
ncbi:MAG: T9SS type A sorting domain-containing protein [Bacteroidales bacterium]|nr:T9SS type A sorting domain-containing protein [Bacteroidales bacterium]